MSDDNRELIDTYIEESREHLVSIEEDLVELERQGENRDEGLVNKIFRAAHSIKGGAGFFDFKIIKELAHKLENVLDLLRSGKMVPNPEVVTILLRGFDRLSSLIDAPEASESADVSDEMVALIGLASEYMPGSKKQAVVKKFSVPGTSRELEADETIVENALARGVSIFLLRFDLIHDVHRLGRTPLDVISSLLATGEIMDCAIDLLSVGTLDDETSGDDVPFLVLYATASSVREISKTQDIPLTGVTLLRLAAAVQSPAAEKPAEAPVPLRKPAVKMVQEDVPTPEPVPAIPQAAKPDVPKRETTESAVPAEQASVGENETVRVSVGVLDDLMNLSGELVLVRNELSDATLRASSSAAKAAVQRMNAVTVGIQDAVMRSRMQPAANLFSRFQRTVRDIARELGKDIDLRLSGKETELDRSLIETLSDPLTHLVRNACDHGIETVETRAKNGKVRRGVISLSAAHEAGQVVLEVTDDGQGIDADKIAAKAVAMGLITAERTALMTAKEKLYLITLPGLSTAKTVSDLSGRGVGMDVVKSNVDRLGGRIDVDSTLGKGTKVRITLPLTLSIIPALIAGVEEERFALPQAAAAELIHVRAGDAQRRIERMGDRPVLVLRGEVLPLVRLASAIGMERYFEDPQTGSVLPDRREKVEDRRSASSDAVQETMGGKSRMKDRTEDDRRFHAASDYRIIVVRASGFRYGVIVDRLFDTTEIVVKPLGRHLQGLKEYSGATILGDGTVSLIIDPAGLAIKAGLTTAGENRDVIQEEETILDEAQGWLLFRNGKVEQCAIPLEAVERVVMVRKGDLDAIGGDLFLRLGDKSIPAFSVSSFTGLTKLDPGSAEACILCHAADRYFGFLASPPVDSVAAVATMDDRSMRKPGVSGTAVIQGQTTVVIDPAGALAALKPEWFARAPETKRSVAPDTARAAPVPPPDGPLLVVAEDSDFFRKMVSDILTEGGYRVREACDGHEALEMVRELGDEVALVVTDVEMPRLDGRELTLRLTDEFPGLPVIALTSLASENDERSLREAGARDYLIKLDRDALLGSVATILETVGDADLKARKVDSPFELL
jgi:two-component system chemotaxis sensor kinase CheA